MCLSSQVATAQDPGKHTTISRLDAPCAMMLDSRNICLHICLIHSQLQHLPESIDDDE